MNNSGQIILYSVLMLVCLLTGYWFYTNFAWVKEEKEIGFQGIAKTNTLLASEFFLRKMGIRTRQVNGLVAFRDLPSPDHTLLIATQRETLNKELSQKLLSWVRSGGHLIIEARNLSPDSNKQEQKGKPKARQLINDHLLEELSVFSTNSHAKAENKDIPVIVSLANEGQSNEIEVNFPYQKILKRNLQPAATLEQPVWKVADELGQYLMQFSLGQGLLTVLSSTAMFNNEQIADYGHARFLHYLVQQSGHDASVWLIRVDDMPALWVWLWEHAWHAMLCLMILLLLWLWRAPLRFGPQLNDAQLERRSLLEHIQASGYYRWHENQSGFLLTRVQEALWLKIQLVHPVIRRENPIQAYAMMAEITGIEEPLIKQALTRVKAISEQEFTRQIQMLEMIRKHL